MSILFPPHLAHPPPPLDYSTLRSFLLIKMSREEEIDRNWEKIDGNEIFILCHETTFLLSQFFALA
jgi:hypothetical protein